MFEHDSEVKPLLCQLGFHDWEKTIEVVCMITHMKSQRRFCKRCNKSQGRDQNCWSKWK